MSGNTSLLLFYEGDRRFMNASPFEFDFLA